MPYNCVLIICIKLKTQLPNLKVQNNPRRVQMPLNLPSLSLSYLKFGKYN